MVKVIFKEYFIQDGDFFFNKIFLRKMGFVWGVGVQMNLLENIVVDVGYEGSNIFFIKINGFNVGVGYCF